MATSRTQLEILIKSVADTTGLRMTTDQAAKLNSKLQETERASEKAATAAKAVGSSAADGAKKMGEFQRAGTDASTMLGGLERASRGGIDGILGIATAFRGFIGLVRGAIASTGPLGILVTVLGLAAGAMLTLAGRSREASASLEEVKRSAQELAKQKLETLNQQIVLAGKNADDTRQKFEQLQAAAERLDNAEQAAALAEIRADTSLSDAEKARRETAVRREFANRADARARARLDANVEIEESKVGAARQAAREPEANFRDSFARRQRLEAQEALLPELEELRRQRVVAMNERSPESMSRANDLGQKIQELEKRTEGFSPEALAAARERSDKELEVANQARARVAEAERGLRVAQETRGAEIKVIDSVAGFRNRQLAADESVAVRSAEQRTAPPRRADMRRPEVDASNLIYERRQAREGKREEALAEIKKLEDKAFRLPSFSPEAKKYQEEAASKRAALAEDDAKFETDIEKIIEESKRTNDAIGAAADSFVGALKNAGARISTGAQEAAAQVSSAPVTGSGGVIVKEGGETVEVPAGERVAPSGPGTISRGGKTIEVPRGDERAVANAARDAAKAQGAANEATISALRDMQQKSERTQRQVMNMRERSQP